MPDLISVWLPRKLSTMAYCRGNLTQRQVLFFWTLTETHLVFESMQGLCMQKSIDNSRRKERKQKQDYEQTYPCFWVDDYCTFRDAKGCSGPSKLQWKAARSSSGKMWFPANKQHISTRGQISNTTASDKSFMSLVAEFLHIFPSKSKHNETKFGFV